MASLDQILDLVESTIPQYNRKTWVDLSSDLQSYIFADQIIGKKRLGEMNSTKVNWKLQISHTNSTRYADLYDTDVHGVEDHLTSAEAKWSKHTDNWSFDVDEEEFASGPEQIIDHIDVREHATMTGIYDFLEEKMWTQPTSDSTRPYQILGIPYWIVKNATLGFNGGDPSSASNGAGNVPVADVPRWKNYTGTYSNVTSTDLIQKIVKAIAYCNFKPAHAYAAHSSAQTPDYSMYTTYPVIEDLELHCRNQNDNLGRDAAAMMGGVPIIRSVPVQWVPALTHDTSEAYDSTNPIYGINWKSLKFHTKKGRWMKKSKPIQNADQHNVYTIYYDSWGQFVCYNRRTNFVFYKA